MSPSTRLLLALLSLSPSALFAQPADAQPAAEPPEKITRFEQMLVRSPGPGRAFDEVFGHWFSSAGPAALEARWRAARDAAPAGSPAALAHGLLLGQLAERIGDSTTARARYAETAAAAPADFRAHHRLGRLEIREGRLAPAIAALEKAAALDLPPADAQDVLRDLARARSRAMDETGALAAWKKLGEKFPDDAVLLEEVGQAQLDAAAYDEAAATFTTLEKAAGGDAYRAVLARLRLGEVAAKKGDKDAALARFSAALDGTHRDSWLHREARARVDSLFRDNGDFDGLVAFHEARLSGASRDPAAARLLAELLLELGRPDAALAWFDKATAWAPDDHALRFAQIEALLAAEKSDAALPLLADLVKRQPQSAPYREALGRLHWDRSKAASDPALAASERASALETWAALAPAGAPVADLLALAEIYRSRGLDEETRATLARALAAEPASFDLRERLATHLLGMKRDDEAWALARNEPAGFASAADYRRLAQLEKRQGLLEPALASLDRGLKLAPDNFELLDLRWHIFAELARWDDALALFPALRSAAPGDFALANVESRHLQALRSASKLEAEQSALAARVAASDPALTEADYRLHVRLAVMDPLPTAPEKAFAAARARFPQSFALAQLEAEHLERVATLPDRVAALRRLVSLRPDRAVEWQRRIVGAHRLEGDYEGARLAAAELLTLAPSDAQNHLLAADIEFESGSPDAGLASLQRALRLAADPVPVRLRLARSFLDQNKPAAALQIFEELFHEAKDDKARRGLVPPLVEAALFAGDLEGVVTRYQERNRPRRESADYHLELGEILLQGRDQNRARDFLTKALDLRRDDVRLMTRLIELARQNGDQEETLRLAKLRHDREATPAHAIELGESLLEANQTEKAGELFLAHATQFYTDATLLPRILPKLARSGLDTALIERLRTQSAGAVDADRRDLVLATALVTARDLDGAERLLWQVYERRPAPLPPAPPANPADPAATPAAAPIPPHQLAWRASQTTYQAFYTFHQLIENQRNRGGSFFSSRSFSSNPQLPPNPAEAQDTALGYLGALALNRGRADAFVARLEETLDKRGVPASTRLFELAKAQAREKVRLHIDAALAETSPDPFGLLTARNFLLEPFDPRTGKQPEAAPEMADRLERLDKALADLAPQNHLQSRMQTLYRLLQSGKRDEALTAAHELRADEKLPEKDRRQVDQFIVGILIESEKWPEAVALLRTNLRDGHPVPAYFGFHLLARFLQRTPAADTPATAAADTALLDELADTVIELVSRPAIVPGQPQLRRTQNLNQDVHNLLFQGATLNLIPALAPGHYWMSNIPAGDATLITAIERAAARQTEENTRIAGLALAFSLAYQSDDEKNAERIGEAILALKPDPALVFNLAELAFRTDRADIARRRYESIVASSSTSLAIAAQSRVLEIALRDEKNRDDAKAAATKLLSLRPPPHLPNVDLDGTLRELGLSTPPRPSSRNQRQSGSFSRNQELSRLSNELNELTNKKDFDAAELVALRLIRETSPQMVQQGNDWTRRRGLETLVRIGRMDAYIANLEAALARSPGSAPILEQLADAHGALRQQSGRAALTPVATSPEPLALPARLRVTRRGDTLLAAHSPVPPAPAATPGETPAPAPAPEWTEFGSIELLGLGDVLPGLGARNQNVRDFAATRLADITLAGAPVDPATLKNRESIRTNDRNIAVFPLASPLTDGATLEFTLLAPSTSGPSNQRTPAERGLHLREPADKNIRASLALDPDGKLVFAVRRHTGLREIEYLSALVSRGRAEDRHRERYAQALFAANRVDEATAFVLHPDNADLLPRFGNNDTLLRRLRDAKRLDDFVDRVIASTRQVAARPLQSRQVDYQTIEFARRLRREKNAPQALRVWEALVDAAAEHQAGELNSEYIDTLLAVDPAAARTRVTALLTKIFLPSDAASRPRPAAFADALPTHGSSPWWTNGGSWNHRPYVPALQSIDAIDAPELLRELINENTPRLAAADADDGKRHARFYDIALRLRAFDPALAPALATLTAKLAEPAKEGPADQLAQAPYLLGAALSRLSGWPDPTGEIEAIYQNVLTALPSPNTRRDNFRRTGPFNDTFIETCLRLAWSDFLFAHGQDARATAALADLSLALSKIDPRQINQSSTDHILARLIRHGAIEEAARLAEGDLRRILNTRNRGNNNSAKHLAALLAAHRGETLKPTLAAWTTPADTPDTLDLRWEISGQLAGQEKRDEENNLPPIFARTRPGAPEGAYDLIVEIFAEGGKEPLARVELPAVASRGRHALPVPLPAGRLLATLRPRAEGESLTTPQQVFSTRPNLLLNPGLHVTPAAKPGEFHQVPHWSTDVLPIRLPFGPNDTSTRVDVAPRNNNERAVRSAPIPIDAKSAYQLEGWAARMPEEHGQISLEFLDADGNVVSNTGIGNFHDPELRWQRFTRVFGAQARKDLPARNDIPGNAVALRVCLGGYGLTVSGLALREVPPAPPPAPAPAPAAPPAPTPAPENKI